MNYVVTDTAAFVNRAMRRRGRRLVPVEGVVRVGNDSSVTVDTDADAPAVEATVWIRAYRDGTQYQGQATVLVPLSAVERDPEAERRQAEELDARLKQEADRRDARVRKAEMRVLRRLQAKYGPQVTP